MSENYDNLRNWIFNSGLFLSKKSDPHYGAIHSYFDEKNNNLGFLYPEITGYFVSMCKFLNYSEKNDNYTKYAIASAEWLVKIHEKYGFIIQGIDTSNKPNKIGYTFDNAICAKSLLDCYELTNDQKFLKVGLNILDWLDDALESNGTLKPYFDFEKKKFDQNNTLWYTQKGCLHIKTAMAFYQAYAITKKSSYLENALLISNSYKLFLNSNNSISLHQNSDEIHIHSMCYALEGLLFGYHHTKQSEFLEICQNGLDWISTKIESDGSLNLWFNSKNTQSRSSYHIAQVLRLMLLVNEISNNTIDQNFINKLFSFLLKLQAQNPQKNIHGGFYEEFYKSIFGWKKRMRLNSWGSLFALQTLFLFENSKNLTFDKSITNLF